MGLVTAASAIAFFTTEMDDLLVMFVLFSKVNSRLENAAIVLGKYLGLVLLVATGKWLASIISLIPYGQLLGLLGIFPIIIGIRFAVREFSGEKDSRQEGPLIRSLGLAALVLETVIITLASGGDNVAVCVSFFSSLTRSEFIRACTVFCIMQAAWCAIAIAVINAASIRNYIEESKGVVIPALFIALGLYILVKSGTAVWLFSQGRLS
jgi:cadmium resistance protein CadD (predicted permease)